MGSRGQSLKSGGFREYNYHTVMRYNKVRFVVQNDQNKSIKLPEMSNSKWSIYATLGRDGKIQSISFFNGKRKKYKEIDFTHFHEKMKPHVHILNPEETSLRSGIVRPMTGKEKAKVENILRFYDLHHDRMKI